MSNKDIAKTSTPVSAVPTTTTAQAVPADPSSTPPDMAGVLEKIQQVRAMDPAAEQTLLDELRQVPPSTWPLVAEQFRASLAYHQQLANKSAMSSRDAQPIVDLRRTPRVDDFAAAEPRLPKALPQRFDHATALQNDRGSSPIGSLVDPHGTNSETMPTIAQSNPYAMPIPVEAAVAGSLPERRVPNQFASDGPTYPIEGRSQTEANLTEAERLNDAKQHVATQAAAKAIATTDNLANLETSANPKHLKQLDDSVGANDWQQLVQKAIGDLEHRVSESPTTTAEVHQHVSLRILRLLAGDTEKALEPIPHISPTEQDYWSRQLFALATYLDHHSQPDDKRRAAASVTHLDEAVSNLREISSLSLRNLSFCKNVYGYGAIEPYESDTFSPGQHVSLYVEVENYHSTSSEKGFRTSLGTTYELLDDKGNRITSGDFPDVNDICRNRRRDFHIQFGLNMPENLSPGRYKLQLVVKDRQSDKIGNAKAGFEIRGSKK